MSGVLDRIKDLLGDLEQQQEDPRLTQARTEVQKATAGRVTESVEKTLIDAQFQRKAQPVQPRLLDRLHQRGVVTTIPLSKSRDPYR